MAGLAGDGSASLALGATVRPRLFSAACGFASRWQKSRVRAVLRCAAALRVRDRSPRPV